jgi:hypothetical protein
MTIYAGQTIIPAGAKIYVNDLNGLGPYLRAELIKKHVPVKVVDEESSAEYVISGEGDHPDHKWHEGFITRRQESTGAIEVHDVKSKQMVWASEAGDRNMWVGAWARDGYRKVADRLATNIAKIVGRP